MADETILNIVRAYLLFVSEKYDVRKAFIFGSFAKNKNNENSDIDVALVLSDFKDYFETQIELMKMRRKFDLRIEPHIFTTNDFNEENPFAWEIIKTGIEINFHAEKESVN